MISTTTHTSAAALSISRPLPGILAVLLGLTIIAGAGFVQANALHEGTHDTRHAFGLPCH